MADDDHECPISGCPRRVPPHQLMCRGHWRQVPADIGRRLYRAWNNGRGAGTREHEEAMHTAINAVEGKE